MDVLSKTSQTVKRTRIKRVATILSETIREIESSKSDITPQMEQDIFDVSTPSLKKQRVKVTTTLPPRAITDSSNSNINISQSIRSQHTEKNDIEDAINAISSLISNDKDDDEYHDEDQDDIEDEDETDPIDAIASLVSPEKQLQSNSYNNFSEEYIIKYFERYNVKISPICIKNILELYQTFIHMNNNKIIKLEINNIDNKVSVFGFNTIIVLNLEEWINEMICLGKQIVTKITDDDKLLERMRHIMTYTGFKAAHYNNKDRSEKYNNLQSKKYIFIDKKMQINAYNAGKIIKKPISNNNIISFNFYKHSPSNTDLSEEYINNFYKSIYNINIETYNIEKTLKVYKFLCDMEKSEIVKLEVDEDNNNISVFGFSIITILSLEELNEKIKLFSGNIIKLKSKDVNKFTCFRSILAITGLKLKRKNNEQKYIYSLDNMNITGYRAGSRKKYRILK